MIHSSAVVEPLKPHAFQPSTAFPQVCVVCGNYKTHHIHRTQPERTWYYGA